MYTNLFKNGKVMNLAVLLSLSCISFSAPAQHQRQMEALDRGLVAMPTPEGGNFVSWRVLGTEPEDISFNLYRISASGDAEKLNPTPLTKASSFLDEAAAGGDVS